MNCPLSIGVEITKKSFCPSVLVEVGLLRGYVLAVILGESDASRPLAFLI